MTQRFLAHFAARDWEAFAAMLADDTSSDDRRRLMGVGVRRGKDAVIGDWRATADVGVTNIRSNVIATRGGRIALYRLGFSGRDRRSGAPSVEVLGIAEIDTDGRIAACVMVDLDDIDAAFEELDARYLAGEAAAHSQTWSVIARAYTAMNRHELPATTPDWVNIDHRRGIAFAPGDATAYLRASQDPQGSVYVETVHRLSNLGAVFTWAGHGTSQEGFEAEWRGINVLTVEGDLINRGEIFDEADLDAALARFEELQRLTPRLENAASRAWERFQACLAAEDWAAMAAMVAEDSVTDDRRRVVGAGVQLGRDVNLANIRATLDIGIENVTLTAIAIRGERLVLDRVRFSGHDQAPEPFHSEILRVLEIDAEERLAAAILFDPDDIDAAFAELDARYLAGEAGAHSQTWSVIARECAAFNRHELPAADWVTIDHRPLVTVNTSDLIANIRATWDLMPDIRIHIEAVHRLSGFGAVVTDAAYGTSPEGFDAEWRMIQLLTVDGDRINRCEIFDETDLDAALARFEELQPQAPRLENAASQVAERFLAHFAAGGWDAMAEILADNLSNDDRRRVVGAGIRHGRDAQIADMRAVADVWATNVTSTVIATRGGRLALMRLCFSSRDQGPERFVTEPLTLVEINADERVVEIVSFDLDDIRRRLRGA